MRKLVELSHLNCFGKQSFFSSSSSFYPSRFHKFLHLLLFLSFWSLPLIDGRLLLKHLPFSCHPQAFALALSFMSFCPLHPRTSAVLFSHFRFCPLPFTVKLLRSSSSGFNRPPFILKLIVLLFSSSSFCPLCRRAFAHLLNILTACEIRAFALPFLI